MSEETKTLFHEKAVAYQEGQDRTKAAGIRTGLSILGVSVIGLIVSVALHYFFQEVCGYILCILPVVIAICAIGIPVGIVWTIVNLVRPTKSVTCPRCGTEHHVYTNVRKYMCTNCQALLLMGKDKSLMPQLSPCPYCGMETAVTADYGRFLCPNCGVVRDSTAAAPPPATTICPECKKGVLPEAIYCTSCHTLLKSDFSHPALGEATLAYDMDWKIGKDAVGHLYFAQALLHEIRQKTSSTLPAIATTQTLLTHMEDIHISLEEVAQVQSMRSQVLDMLREVDLAYANLLQFALISIQQTGQGRQGKDALKVLASDAYIKARRRIEDWAGEALTASGSIGRWEEKLVQVEQANKYSRITGFVKLQGEATRFAQWKEQQGA